MKINKLVPNESGFIGSNYPDWVYKLIDLVRKLLNIHFAWEDTT